MTLNIHLRRESMVVCVLQDVLILSQFLRADGCVLPRTVTGLCYKAQCRLQRLVHQSQRAGQRRRILNTVLHNTTK